MADDNVPDEVRDFIQRHIDSVAHLEALLLLRANPDTQWTVAATAKRLYATETEIADVLARLCAEGFLDCTEDIYRYDCRPAERERVDRLAAVCARHLIPITNLIHAKPRRIRQFADAFKFRKDR